MEDSTKPVYLYEQTLEQQKLLSETLNKSADGMTQLVIDTGLEVQRQLSIVNGAGIAGATAMLSSMTGASSSLPFFCLGMTFSVSSLVLSYFFGLANSIQFRKIIIGIQMNVLPLSALKFTKLFYVTTALIWISAGLSLLMFMVGVHKLTGVFSIN